MNCSSSFVYAEEVLKYQFHQDHPFNQIRVKLAKDLLQTTGSLSDEEIISPRMATEDELALFHDVAYIDAVKRASKGLLADGKGLEFGLGTEDTPIFPNMHEAAAWLVGGTLRAVESVLSGHANHALHLGGGLHHGFKRKASGFCIYNDCAVAIKYIRKHYNLKVLYIDTDAHHGDGVQWAFYDDPNVCTISFHETGRYLFPGTGEINERGIKEGHGFAFNIPLDAFTEDESFMELYHAAIRDIMAYFQPDIIVTQNGADAHTWDPLTHLCGTMKIYEAIPLYAHQMAHQYCDGKWIALGGGGYDVWRVVPRAWAQIWNVMKHGKPLAGDIPAEWIKRWQNQSPHPLPNQWQDNPSIVPNIARKQEIQEKNRQTLQQALKITNQHKQL
ncbi:acetoin utilization protein AcuC [Ornithinibacillus gellani]|uniref:acetoin utilization protein AcuC n=1 Tax=Ornithinibacillus gellani TaxID=2293253 RepID=UPI000F4A511F|nr:acetoin utilization protein AcuC [Ornithinibacillus gellani]TQS75444.1 acetoin utilization protein AcuC [Ornithinibacillus gellani]